MTDSRGEIAFDSISNAIPDADGLLVLPLIILSDDVVLPHTITPMLLDDDDPRYDRAMRYGIKKQQTVIFVTQPDEGDGKSLSEQIQRTGTEAAIVSIDDPTYNAGFVMVQGRRRVQITGIEQELPFVIAKARIVDESKGESETLNLLRMEAIGWFDEIAERNDMMPEDVIDYIHDIEDYSELADVLISTIPLTAEQRQELLEAHDLTQRYRLLNTLLQREIGALDVRDDVNSQVQDEINRVQREMYLREQMRIIQEELGESDFFENELEELREQIKTRLPEEVRTQALKELSRLTIMSPMSPEAGVIRTYIDWLLDLPWQRASHDKLNLRHAEKILNREHYGLEKVKERILEHIAVRKLAGSTMKTPIICFLGPPGVGKTSLGKSIAEALGREFVRVSLGGVRDEAEIRGHRRTYIGALPGRIVQTMKRAGTVNPVFMLDEIDKMSDDYRGDPAAALLEVLDPEQNSEFVDHYLEVPYDLSQVLFIATANELWPLPEALEDRLEVIEFRAYTEEEKLEIARRFLIPKQLRAHGLHRRGIQFQDSAILYIIRSYTLEAGVRNLEREIATVCRKITRQAAMRKKYPKRVTPVLVEKSLGPPYVLDTRLTKEDLIGVVTGLVWTSGGGDIQLIEAALLPGKGTLTLTGSLGDVLQESAQIALTYMRSRAIDMDVPEDDFENFDVHIHMPEGAVPKDGPSAGITLATAIISVFTERAVRGDWAMTGEVTLRGHVLAVGGVKEKVLAARRRGIVNVILPADNEKDLVELPKRALKDMNIKLVRNMQEVIETVLLEAPQERQRDLDRHDDDDEREAVEDDNR